MRVITIKLSDSEYENLMSIKGDKTVSDYIRELIKRQNRNDEKEGKDFMMLMQKLDSFLNSHGQQKIIDELIELKRFVCIGSNKNLHILLQVLHDGDEKRIKEDYDKLKTKLQQI